MSRIVCGMSLYDDIENPVLQTYNRVMAIKALDEDGLPFLDYYAHLGVEGSTRVVNFLEKLTSVGLEDGKRTLKRAGML